MKISYKHLYNKIKQKPGIEEISQKLFQLGHEHKLCNDIFDIEFTPNRGDCLSVRGLLRDLSFFYEIEDECPIYNNKIKKLDIEFSNNEKKYCPKISFLKIEIEELPNYYNKLLEDYFSVFGLKKNNFFTDISNYILYETGQPTHCYEASNVCEGIKLEFLEDTKDFQTLLDKTIKLNHEDLVFLNNNNEIINLAGVVGGKNSSCTKDTKSIILECAYFNPEAVVGKAVKHSINSEAAHRFERNVDPNCHDYVLRRFIKIVEQHVQIKNLEIFQCTYLSQKTNKINLCHNSVNKILGTDITKKDYIHYMERLGFYNDGISITVPSYRHDVSNQNDLAEEVARGIGYDNIPSINSTIKSNSQENIINENEINIKNLLVDNNFCEVINDPFVQKKSKSSIEVDNPLDINRRFLRTNIRDSLIRNLAYNERRQKDSIKLFEISDIYQNKSNHRKRFIGIIVSGRVNNNYKDFNKKLNKKYLSNLLDPYIFSKTSINYEIISRELIDSKSINVVVYAEIEINSSFECNYLKKDSFKNSLNDVRYQPISDFPSSTRDLSFSITDFKKSKHLQDYMFSLNEDLLNEVFIFDYYFNEEKSQIKIGFRLIFQSCKETIKDVDVNRIMDEIIYNTKKIKGISIPGLN